MPLILFLIKIVEWTGPYITIVFLLSTALFKIVLLYLYLIVIMPFFAKFKDLPESELRNKVEQLAKSVNFKPNKTITLQSRSEKLLGEVCPNRKIYQNLS